MSRNKLSGLIDGYHAHVVDEVRNYIGASSIGSECVRQIWYQYKGVSAQKVPAKFRKTWALGKAIEHLIVDWMLKAGLDVELSDKTYHADEMPYFQGHFDGILTMRKKKYILEIKTAKHASFIVFEKKGLKAWNPQYYAQIQSYMGMSGLFSAYILVLNKDNSAFSDELVVFDPDFYNDLLFKARAIKDSHNAPPRINDSPMYYKCKMCKFSKNCHEL